MSPYDNDAHRESEMHDVREDARRLRDAGVYSGGYDASSARAERSNGRGADDSSSWWRSEHEDWSPGQRDLLHDFSHDSPIHNRGGESEYGYRGYQNDRFQPDRSWDHTSHNDRGDQGGRGYQNDRGYQTEGSGDRTSHDDRRHWSSGLGAGISNTLPRYKEFIGKGPKGFVRSDERIEEEIAQRLAHGYLDASDIELTVKNGEVTLQGTVATKHDRRLAEDLIEGCFGVKEVDNRLKVQRGKMAGADDSMSFGRDSKGSPGTSAVRGIGATGSSRRTEA